MTPLSLPLFKPWAPEWLIRLMILLVLFPALGIFALYFSNSAETTGYYGMEPADVQYSVVIMYATLVSFLPLDDRFVKYLMPRQYFLIGIGLNTLTYLICGASRSIEIFMICRFIQGAVCALFCSICLNMIFSRLKAVRARVIGYTVFYGILQVTIPACALLCTWLLHYFEFNILFYVLILLEIPGIVLLLLLTNNVRFRKKFPLYQIDWISYLFYTFIFCAGGYIFIYGQQLNWLDSPLMRILILSVLTALFLFVLRQFHLKRPFINLKPFRFANFRNGLLLLILYYIFKGTTSYAYACLQGILGVDPVHLSPIWLINIAGIILGMLISSRFILNGTSGKYMIIAGFSALLLYHIQLYFLFSSVSNTNDFLLPFFIQGLGAGGLFVPIVLFTASSVPAQLAGSVSFIGIGVRFVGFCMSIAISNYFQLFNNSIHYDKFRAGITVLNPAMNETMDAIRKNIALGGQDTKTATSLSSGVWSKMLNKQVFLRASMDYYEMITWAMLVLILVLLLAPQGRGMILALRKRFLPY